MRNIHPPLKIFKMADGQGGEYLSESHWLGTWQVHFDDESLYGGGHIVWPIRLSVWSLGGLDNRTFTSVSGGEVRIHESHAFITEINEY